MRLIEVDEANAEEFLRRITFQARLLCYSLGHVSIEPCICVDRFLFCFKSIKWLSASTRPEQSLLGR